MSGERLWGWWTEWKLELLRYYLRGFVKASKRVGRTTYLDLFAGAPGNRSRETGDPIESSAEIALAIDPPFTHLRLFEKDRADELSGALSGRFPGRDMTVVSGDCNEMINQVLGDASLPTWAPTFAFIDPDGPHCRWTTLEALADHKRAAKYKVELWMLFPVGMFTRNLPLSGDARPADRGQLTLVFGTDGWEPIYKARVEGEIDADRARFEYVNLMRWRLERDLGYRWTHAFDVRNSKNAVLYTMIFATDNATGNKIMGDGYSEFARRHTAMAEEARLRQTRQGVLFSLGSSAPKYRHEPPLPPYGSPGR